jgi:hypothetical protein
MTYALSRYYTIEERIPEFFVGELLYDYNIDTPRNVIGSHPNNALAILTLMMYSTDGIFTEMYYLDDCGKRMIGFGSQENTERVDRWLTIF